LATDFLNNYQIPLRIVSIAILLWALYAAYNKIAKPCSIFNNTNKEQYIKPRTSRDKNNGDNCCNNS
jgi:hypothetical protein